MMTAARTLAVLVGLVLLPVVLANAGSISIDGSDSDWASPDVTVNDPDEPGISQGQDIDYCYYEWDHQNDHACFMFQTYDVTQANNHDDLARIMINADSNVGTGGPVNTFPGMEYFINWKLGASDPITLYEWTGSWTAVASPAYVAVARGDIASSYTIFEWAVDADDIGRPASFVWSAYLDNGGGDADDYCQGIPGQTPELGTMVLLAITLVGGGAVRRWTGGKRS